MNGNAEASARDTILQAVRKALPQPPVSLPTIPFSHEQEPMQGGVGYHGDLATLQEVEGFPKPGEPLLEYFRKHLTAMGGRSYLIKGYEEVQNLIAELFPKAQVVCSTIADIPSTRPVTIDMDSRSMSDVDVAIVRSRLGVAEAGAVLLRDVDLVVPSLGLLAQHVVVVLAPSDIVPTLHEVYAGRFTLAEHAYSVFMAGPSATGDIEGVIVHGAQGPRSITVLLLPE